MTNNTPATSDRFKHLMNADYFRGLVDFGSAEDRVRQRLLTLTTGDALVRFFSHYAAWNGRFANGVSLLVGMIGDSTDLFRERGFPRALSDRSNYIASFFFDAIRDEYDDHINPARDPHRSMAQAALLGMNQFFDMDSSVLDEVEPSDLAAANASVMRGYTGQLPGRLIQIAPFDSAKVRPIFAGIGYHLGSELLADREFTIIDRFLRSERPDLVKHLLHTSVDLTGGKHRCYAWIGVHSGEGGGAEADHFDLALSGARAAFDYLVGEHLGEIALASLVDGFREFERHHARFFAIDPVTSQAKLEQGTSI